MRRLKDSILVESNFKLRAFERGKYVKGSLREGHNVFTNAGADWIASLVAWATIGGGPDVPFTNRRVRWMGLGTGTQTEVPGVTSLNAPTIVTPGVYLGAIQLSLRPTARSVQFVRDFGQGEISLPAEALPIVAITEAALFADVYPVSVSGGLDDGAVGSADTTLDPTAPSNPSIAYHTFEAANKTVDFTFRAEWTFTF